MSRQQQVVRETDDDARTIGQDILRKARFGSLGVLCAETGAPLVSRVSVGTDAEGHPVSLMSKLSLHTQALRQNPACSLLVGEPAPRGDPLIHPRLTLQCTAEPVQKDALKPLYLAQHPKATLYFDFADFLVFRLNVSIAHLIGGFGKAFRLTPEDLHLV